MTQKTRIDLLCDLSRETNKLNRLGHPRIVVTTTPKVTSVAIDTWCDGSEAESQKVMQITRRYTALGHQLGAYDVNCEAA